MLQPGQRPTQRLDVGDVHAELVALGRLDHHDRPGDRASDDLRVAALAGLGGEQLRVGETGHDARAAVGQDHGGGDQRAGARTASGLVDAGDRREPDPSQRALVAVQSGVAPDRAAAGQRGHRRTHLDIGETTSSVTRRPAAIPG